MHDAAGIGKNEKNWYSSKTTSNISFYYKILKHNDDKINIYVLPIYLAREEVLLGVDWLCQD